MYNRLLVTVILVLLTALLLGIGVGIYRSASLPLHNKLEYISLEKRITDLELKFYDMQK